MDRQQHQGNARENRSPKKQWPAARKIDDTALWWNVAGGKKKFRPDDSFGVVLDKRVLADVCKVLEAWQWENGLLRNAAEPFTNLWLV